jgi:ribose 1,5-bisphosphate isomerase
MIASLRKRVNAIIRDREHGAGWLAAQAVDVLREASTISSARTSEKFAEEINGIIDALLEVRPGMVSISNYALQFKDEFTATAPASKSADNLKKRAAAIARKLMIHNETASSRAARNAVKLIGQRNIIMTCSYSSDVCATLELARQKGIDFKVLAIESHIGKISYGDLTAKRLEKSGIICRPVPDDFANWHVARANLVLMGAAAVSLQGWMLNCSPSYSTALLASRKKVPVYAVCTTAKFDVRGFLAGLGKPQPGFDSVPLDLLKGIVTEKGMLQPEDIYEVTIEDIFRSALAGPD